MDNNLDKDYDEIHKLQTKRNEEAARAERKRNEYDRIFKNSFQSKEIIPETTFVVKGKTKTKPKTSSKKWAMIGIIGIMLSTGIVVHSNADNIDKAQDYLKDQLKNPLEQERLHNESVISDAVDALTKSENEEIINEMIKEESQQQLKDAQVDVDTSSAVGTPGILYDNLNNQIITEVNVEEAGRSY